MSQDSLLGHTGARLAAPLVGRDPAERHRSATPLELFFDLVFVVALASAGDALHHGVVDGAVASSVLSYVLVFFALYLAWVNFTWFASAFDNDDLVYRLFVFLTMTGALVFAAGVTRVFEERDFTVVVLGYSVMRVALISQWLRVARADSEHRRAARRFAGGLALLQIAWAAALLLPPGAWLALWVLLAVGELAVPVWAESGARTSWHARHIAERYGLFMMIVLGESVLAASRAIGSALDGGDLTRSLTPLVVGGLLLLFSMWWLYFERPDDRLGASLGRAFTWSYLHFLVFGAAAAVGAGLAVTIDDAAGHSEVSSTTAALSLGVAVAVYLLSLQAMYIGPGRLHRAGLPVAAVLVVAACFTPLPVLLMGVVVAGLVVLKTASRLRAGR